MSLSNSKINIKDSIKFFIKEALSSFGVEKELASIHLEHPLLESHGNYSTNISLHLSKTLKLPPIEIANKIKDSISTKENSTQIFSKVEVIAPGFINFFIQPKFLFQKLSESATEFSVFKNNLLNKYKESQKEKVLIEHTQVNPNKAPHIGHLRNTCIGDALKNIYTYFGYSPKILYYQNDVGQQIASIVLAYKKNFIKKENFSSLIEWASSAYSDIDKKIEEGDEDIKKEKEQIQINIASQDHEDAMLAHTLTRQILKETLLILKKLEVEYDLIVEESAILKNSLWDKTFSLLKNSPNFYLSTSGEKLGCYLLKMDSLGQEDKIIVRSNGVPTYVGNDIANHLWKFGILDDFCYQKIDWYTQDKSLFITLSNKDKDYCDTTLELNSFTKADKIINVIDTTQTYPQESVKESLRVLGYQKEADNYLHINYGFVYLSIKTAKKLDIDFDDDVNKVKISGRKGSVLSISNFLHLVEEELHKNYGDFENIDIVRNGAIKFELLKYNTYEDIIFDLDSALSVRGFSGPYIQYSYVRALNIFKKKDNFIFDINISLDDITKEELSLLNKITHLEEVLEKSFITNSPHIICLYLFELSQKFNSFYESSLVIGDIHEIRRLTLVNSFLNTIKLGLEVLGIKSPDKM